MADKKKSTAKKWKSRAKDLADQLAQYETSRDKLKAKLKSTKRALKSAQAQTAAAKAARKKAAKKAAEPKTKAPLVSPLAPKDGFPNLPEIAGVEFAAAGAEVKYKDRLDVMLAKLAPGTIVAGCFTTSATRSAAVLDCQAKLSGRPKSDAGAAIVVNSGNANAFTGAAGETSVDAICSATAEILGIPAERVFTASTGVIGEPLPHERITAQLGKLNDTLSPSKITHAAQAIMTTDTYPKGAMAEIEVGGQPIRIAGIAKGSGMIAPNMATMLVYIFTDATIGQTQLQNMVRRLNSRSFNAITVDSDTSTSDTLIVAATGQGPAPALTDMRAAPAKAFEAALQDVMLNLAHQVVRDGEGATKFAEITVTGARSNDDAKTAALSIANSPLVKTALAGEDPNWGRIVAAVGKAGVEANRDKLDISFGDIQVATDGQVDPEYAEADGAAYFKNDNLTIGISLGVGRGKATVWTCDLTKRYIEINADYRS